MEQFQKRIERQKKEEQKMFDKSMYGLSGILDSQAEHRIQKFENEVLASVNQILSYFKMPEIDLPPGIRKEEQFEYLLNLANIMQRSIELEGVWWKEDAIPLLCQRKEGEEWVVLLPKKLGGYHYFDEQQGKYVTVNYKRAKEFHTKAFCFYRPLPNKSLHIKDLFIYLLKVWNIADWIFLIGSFFIVSLLGLILPEVNSYIYDQVIPSGSMEDILPITTLLVGVVFSSGLFHVLKIVFVLRMGDKIKLVAEAGIWNRILNLPATFFKKYESGDLTNRVLTLSTVCDMVTTNIIPVILTTVFSSVFVIQIGTFSTSLLAPTLMIAGVMLGFAILCSVLRAKINRNGNVIMSRLSGFVFQLYNGISKLKICGAEIRAYSQWAKIFQEKLKNQITLPLVLKYADAIVTIINIGGVIITYLVVYENELSASVYISFQVAFGCLTAAIARFSGLAGQMAYIKPALEMVQPLFESVPESDMSKIRVQSLGGKINVSNVSFRYDMSRDYVLHELNLSIQPGEYVAVVGPSGCGKSTLFRLLLGFEQPEVGAIYFDDRDYEQLDRRSVRQCMGTVLQDGKLFMGDIYSNIALCTPGLSMEEAFEAAERAGIRKEIEEMPMGMFTMISEAGGGISGGQKQRILIARTLAMQPDILLFDEATSALDNITQATIVNTLMDMDITRIVIAHRLSTVQQCDRIIYLENGKVAEEGTYEELIKLDKKFAEMAKRQLV